MKDMKEKPVGDGKSGDHDLADPGTGGQDGVTPSRLRRSSRDLPSSGGSSSRTKRRSRGLPLVRPRKTAEAITAEESGGTVHKTDRVSRNAEIRDETSADKITITSTNASDEIDSSRAKERKVDKEEVKTESPTNSRGRSSSNPEPKRPPELIATTGEGGKEVKVRLIVNFSPFIPSNGVGQRDLLGSRRINIGSDHKQTKPDNDPSHLGHDGNLFYCHVCRGFGDVVCCDGCPRVYHIECIPEGDPSRLSLENNEDHWYCPECMEKKPSSDEVAQDRSSAERRLVKRRCCECQRAGGNNPMEPCEGCGVYLHHPSCRKDSAETEQPPGILCSTCRAEAAMSEEENDFLRREKKRKLGLKDKSVDKEDSDEDDEGSIKRRRTRSMDLSKTAENDDGSTEEEEASFNPEGDRGEDGDTMDGVSGQKRKRSSLGSKSDETPGKKAAKKKKKKKKKKKIKKDTAPVDDEEKLSVEENIPESPVLDFSRRGPLGMAQATPAFFFFLQENRFKIERALARKHRYFYRLPKGEERNELVAKEGALWWVKLRPTDHRRFMNMSMRDFEQRIIEWKEEKNIRDMMVARDSEDEGAIVDDGGRDFSASDEMLTYNRHERLYMGTTVGSKPFQPEKGQSHNRILLELLQDMRFHPLPMFSANRPDFEWGQMDYSRTTIPYFDVHGPVSTSVGDECLGCTRGWNHFCPVLKRRIPAVEHRAKLQPPLSSITATRVGLGLRPRAIQLSRELEADDKNVQMFSPRETPDAAAAKHMSDVPSFSLTDPSSREDDIVQFVEEAVAMKVPEPPRPNVLSKVTSSSSRGRGSLPLRDRKRGSDSTELEFGDGSRNDFLNKCGRCRTIIRSDTGCVQCRRAQLVINMSKRQPASAPSSHGGRAHKSDSKNVNLLKVQTTMLGRISLKDSGSDIQPEGDVAISSSILRERWTPCIVLPPAKTLVPDPSRRASLQSKSNEKELDSNCDSTEEFSVEGDKSDILPVGSFDAVGKTASAYDEQPDDMDVDSGGMEKRETEMTNLAVTEDAEDSKVTNDDEAGLLEEDDDLRKSGKRFRSARLVAAAAAAGDSVESPDRQKVAEEHKKKASELQKKTLSIACCGILLAMMRRDPLLLFAQPVTAEGYTTIVKHPIDFGKIRANVLSGKYQTLGSFVSDARLLCTNALAYNPWGSIYWKTAKELYDVLAVMQKRASEWMTAIRDAHAFAWRRIPHNRQSSFKDGNNEEEESLDTGECDPLEELRIKWPEAVEMYENSDWLRNHLAADFMRTKENETAYYGSLAVRRVATAAEASLAPYPDSGGTYSLVAQRSHAEDAALRNFIDEKVSELLDPVQLKDIPTWREESIVKVMRRVQGRRLEGRIGSENGCARCDGIRIDQEMKNAMHADSFRYVRPRKRPDSEVTRVAASRLPLTTGLASKTTRKDIKDHSDLDITDKYDNVGDVRVSVRGSRIHGWGLFADQHFKKGDPVAEYLGEYVTFAVADAREKAYQEQRIQDYQFRVDESLVIDATMKGGHGRYINHNCNPNCFAKIIPGKAPNQHLKRVIIIAQRSIEPREELTYDYQFPLELDLDVRIPCNCQSDVCRGFMNWDLPEKGSKNRLMRGQKRGGNMRDRIRRLGRPLKK